MSARSDDVHTNGLSFTVLVLNASEGESVTSSRLQVHSCWHVLGVIFEAWHCGRCELTGLLLVEGHVRVGLALQRSLRAMVRFD